MPGLAHRAGTRFRALLGADSATLRQGLAALLVSSGGDLLAGLTLGAITGTLADLPGLLVLVPAAIGMRGNVFGALGSRFGTSIHTGTFSISRRAETVVGQNVIAAMALSVSVSFALAILAKAVSIGFGLAHTIPVSYFIVISVVGGVISSVFVLLLTIGVAAGSVRFGWDMDNVAAPLVTAAGDMVTLPSLFVATFIVGPGLVTPILAVILGALSVAALVAALRSGLPIALRILRESVPVLLVCGLIDVVAGLTIEKRLESFLAFPALLVLVPPFLEDTGALGGILSARLASKLHLGTIEPSNVPPRVARDDFVLTFVFAVPVFTLVAISSDVAANVAGLASPGVLKMVAISLIGGFMATVVAIGIVYYGAIATYRLGLDPDNHGIPLITSSMDLVGAFALILAIVLVGVH
ncbi:MAG TPA: magnesium transporter [Acidimicrobiales bacterium]|jgi:mgtE-like transporter|nr:magnesium transporter [Acidimicrobiales bacterium]